MYPVYHQVYGIADGFGLGLLGVLGLLGGRIIAQLLTFVLDFLDAVPVLCAYTHELGLLQASALLFFRCGDVGIRDSSYNVTVSIYRSILYGIPRIDMHIPRPVWWGICCARSGGDSTS